ncbi:MAG TPA: hypothetical protein ENI23_11190 [bacterium]|nr:hypothetical protein [bacterium]
MERETKEIITPVSKQKVVVKTWITAGEDLEIRKAFYKSLKVKGVTAGDVAEFSDIDATILLEREKKAIEVVVVSVDGDKKDILDRVLGMRREDYLLVKVEITKVIGGEDFTKPE